jgi:purine-binding chemotaxis protein CheW
MIIETEKDTIGMLIDSVNEVMSVKEKDIHPVPNFIANKINQKFLKNVIIRDERIIILLNLSKLNDDSKEEIVVESEL